MSPRSHAAPEPCDPMTAASIPAVTAPGVLTIDLAALRANYRLLIDKAAGAAVAGVVKADGYGLGAGRVASALWDEGCRTFFVAHLDEAMSLRAQLPPAADIYVLNGLAPGSEAACRAGRIRPVLNSLDQIAAWRRTAGEAGIILPAALQIDTGMSRLGLSASEVATLRQTPSLLEGIDAALLMSHLACADEPAHPANQAQLRAFQLLADILPQALRSLANSAGVFLGPDYHFDLVRPGIALYGGCPTSGGANPMRPVVRLDARVVQLRQIPAGAGIGYGLAEVADHPMRLATIAIGYADGWPRCIGEVGAAFYKGHRLPITGRVSMDSIILGASDDAAAGLGAGEFVELIGSHQSLERVAADAGTISYEILTSLGRRFERRFVDGAETEFDR